MPEYRYVKVDIVRDDSSHRYVIPSDRRHEWWAWVDSGDWDEPYYAIRMDGGGPDLYIREEVSGE